MRKPGFSLLTLVFLAVPAWSGDVPLRKQLLEMNKLTGGDAVKNKVQELTADKEHARKLIRDALELTKDKKFTFGYNTAYILAQVAAEFKDLPASEKFYRICGEYAVKLQSPQKILEAYGGIIDLLYDNKKYAESAAICRELLELKTDDGKERIVLQSITTRLGEHDFVEVTGFDAGRRFRPGVHRLLIQAMSKQGKFDKALELVDNLIKANDHWLERQLRGWVLREAGQYAEAAKVYEDVIERVLKDGDLEGDEREYYEERYRYALSNIYIDLRNVKKAGEQLELLVKRKPDEPGYHNDLGYIWADNDMNLDQAEKLVRRALELDRKRRMDKMVPPELDHDNGAYLDSMGWVLYKQKKYKEALDHLLKAVEDKSAQHIEIYDHLGDVYIMLGDRDKALEAWRTGLKHVGEGRREVERKEQVERKIEKHSK